jgi:photosystem II stability/assembly factor-like uncharacterized protein
LKRLITLSATFFVAIFCLTYLERNTAQEAVEPASQNSEEYFNGPAEFAKFQRDIRTAEGESKPGYKTGYKLKELRKAKEVVKRFSARAKSNGVTSWTERGPANVPGRTRGIIVDPDDATKNTWFAGSVGGGVWKTTNAGTSWTNITPDLPNLSTSVLAMAPSNTNVIYIGTGEGFFNLDAIDGTGIFKSTDKGATWSLLNSTLEFADVNRIAVAPNNADIVIAATNEGIYRSTNGGTTWNLVLEEAFIQDLKADPTNFNIQYAAQNSVGVWKSIDAGQTWTITAPMGSVGRIEIAVSPVNSNKIFASAEKESFGDGSKLLMTSNAGNSWSFVDVKINNTEVDFLGGAAATDGQGWYDNTIACDPFNQNKVYYAGIDMFTTEVGANSGTTNELILNKGTATFLTLINFGGSNGTFDVGGSSNNTSIELRFGPGQTQKAHRFLVPEGATSGVLAANYAYQNYVDVPFTAWDITANPDRQLMVSFRDQGRNNVFDLIQSNTTSAVATEQSREYVFVNNVDYNPTTPNISIAAAGGHEFNEMYNIWPTLTDGETWPPSSSGTLKITFETFTKVSSTTTNITDGRGTFGNGKNNNVHVDHHSIVMVPMTASTYKIINANDGGVFVSNTSSTPGVNNNNWTATDNGYNSSQFYGADKKTGADQYFGGMQDNGTWLSPAGQNASSSSDYNFKIGGDGFEVIWHNTNTQLLIGGSQGNRFARSTNGGASFVSATSGLGSETEMPFISKLANSRALPDKLFTLGLRGVFVSNNFGQNWRLTPITQKWGNSSAMDIDVSRANPYIVWAGLGMTATLNLHVSTDGGVTFKTTNNYTEVSMGTISKLASHPTEPFTAYALFSLAEKPKILKTTDLGNTWVDISGFDTNKTSSKGFPDVAVYCLYIRPDDTNIIWAGTEIGIVESQDGGETWALLDDFPNVAVWDMKGVDDQIVIATHGRGIWTASVGAEQFILPENISPTLSAVGTDPNGNFALLLEKIAGYDSLRIYVDDKYISTIDEINDANNIVVTVSNLQKGIRIAYAIAYKDGGIPYGTNSQSGELLTLKPTQDSHSDYFSNLTNFKSSGFSLQLFNGQSTASRKTLQTAHPYIANTTPTSLLLVPITIKAGTSQFSYRDVAIVEPLNDSVVVEATKDGVNWVVLEPAYDASFNTNWLSTYNSATPNNLGNYNQMVSHSIDLLSKFAAGDKVLFRFRLASNATVNAWGWGIDYVAIQEEPKEAEYAAAGSTLSLYPNPTAADAILNYTLTKTSDVSIELTSTQGKRISLLQKGRLPEGEYSERIKTANLNAGIYLVIVRKSDSIESMRLVVQ